MLEDPIRQIAFNAGSRIVVVAAAVKSFEAGEG